MRNKMKQAANLGLVVVGDGFDEDAPGDNPSEGIGLMQAKLEMLKKQLTNTAGACRSLNSRSIKYEEDGNKEQAVKAVMACEAKRQEAEQLKAEIAALKAQIDLQKKYS